LYDVGACHEFGERNGERVGAPRSDAERNVVGRIRIWDRVWRVAVYLHDKIVRLVVLVGSPIEQDTDCRRLRIRWHVKHIPTGELTRAGALVYAHCAAAVGSIAVVERVVAEIAIGERPIERNIVPGKSVDVLTWPISRVTAFRTTTGTFARVIVCILDPDESAGEAQVWPGDGSNLA